MSLMRCPTCHREYDQGFLKCPYDGSALVDAMAQNDPFIGRQLANTYQIVRQIGAGGMGAVYEARHVRLDTPFAVKLLYPELSLNEELLARFHREARSASQLRHPNILDVFDVNSTEDGIHYIVEEFLDGEPLSSVVERDGIVDLQQGVHVLSQTCDAMAAAHAKDIIHRDLKPENIFLLKKPGDDNFVKVLDFGIAKMQEEGKAQLTQVAQVMGTPDYISPEQATNAKDAAATSDIYSLGVVVYRMFTGRLPYEIENPALALEAVKVQDPVPPRVRYPNISPAVESVILRSIARDPAQRFPSMLEMKQAIDALAQDAVDTRGDASIPRTVIASQSTGPPQGPPATGPQWQGQGPQTGPNLQAGQSGQWTGAPTPVAAGQVRPVTQQPASKGPVAAVIAVGVAVLIAGAVGGWYFFIRDDGTSTGGGGSGSAIAKAADAGAGSAAAPTVKADQGAPKPDAPVKPKAPEGMVLIAGGSFEVGRADGAEHEKPVHRCEVKSFYLDKTEVTRAAFAKFVSQLKAKATGKAKKRWESFKVAGDGALPINNVSWHEARAYCQSLGKRLPRETEWEYAARGSGHRSLYPGGDALPGPEQANVCRVKGKCKEVKLRAASQPIDGLSDMIGNAGEWVEDAFAGYTKTCDKRQRPPKKYRYGGAWKKWRVIRGGSVTERKARLLTATYRFFLQPQQRDRTVGFRCAKDAR